MLVQWMKISVAILLVTMGFLSARFGDKFKEKWYIVLPISIVLAIANLLIDFFDKKLKLEKSWKKIIEDSKRKLTSNSIKIPHINEHIKLKESKQIETLLYENKHIILIGAAGVGKTGIITEISERYKNFTYLYFDCRDILKCQNLNDLKEVYNIDHGLNELLKKKRKKNRIKIILDQCDSIWRTEGKELLFRVINQIVELENIQLILICRIEEANGLEEDINKQCDIGAEKIRIEELDDDTATHYLKIFGYVEPATELILIAKNIFNITILSEICNNYDGDIKKISNIYDFWDEYRRILEGELYNNKSKFTVTSTCGLLAKKSLLAEDGTFMLNARYTDEEDILLSRGVINKIRNDNLRCRFRHEKLREYMYCYNMICIKGIKDFKIIEDELGEQAGLVAPTFVRILSKQYPEDIAGLISKVLDNE
ncbi:AAA family ATPase [candidate division KSB1 bacterium]|nr:AAA family ATPase [candidate division KSB1 bacterium]